MKWWILIIFLLLPSVSANTANIDISIASDGLVTEEFIILVNSDAYYDSFEFETNTKPLSISYDDSYEIQELEDSFLIVFDKEIVPGSQELEFSIIYEKLVENAGRTKVFRSGFSAYEDTSIKLSLPRTAVLSGNPSTTPEPSSISSDGEVITLNWEFSNEEPNIVVFYEQSSTSVVEIMLVIILLVIVVGFAFFFYSKSRLKRIVEDTLTEDEKLILQEVRKGNIKQKDIANSLDFSKSKMSKVVRKLEEKDLIKKEPHFKTYKIKIKKIK